MKSRIAFLVLAGSLLSASALAQGPGIVMAGPLGGIAPPTSGPTTGVDTASNQGYICNAGTCKAQSIVISSQGAQTALTTVTTAQAMFTYALPAGFMNVAGRVLTICGSATFSNAVTTPAITVSVKIGSVTPVSAVSAANANSNTTAPLNFCFTVKTAATGASGTDEAHGCLLNATSAAFSSGTALATYCDNNTAVSSTYDHTAANTLTVNIAADAALTSVVPRLLVISAVL